jgi:hypothetical protein
MDMVMIFERPAPGVQHSEEPQPIRADVLRVRRQGAQRFAGRLEQRGLDHPLISELRRRMLDEAVGSLAEATNEAVITLRELLGSENENVRLRASLGIFDAVVRMREHAEFEQRIIALEARLGSPESSELAGEEGDDDGWESFRRRRSADPDGVA